MTTNSLKRKSTLAGLAASILVASLSLGASGTTHAQGLTAARADIDDDGFVGFSDIIAVFMRFGQRNGDTGFREGLDLAPNGRIDYGDIVALFPFYYRSGVPTSPTTVSGVVYDGFGAALPNVIVSVGPSGTPSAPTANNGSYTIDAAGMGGDTEINFNGSAAIDPSPGVLSGQFPSIPHKPIFVNGGTNNVFRIMSLPERDFNGSVFLNSGNATNNGNGNFTLTQPVTYANPAAAGAAMTVPAGASMQFPAGEQQRLSVMNVDPAFSPAPLPPGAGSTNVFVSFQPGGTVIEPSPGETLVVCFDNVDLFQNVYVDGALDLDNPNQPMLLGVEGGVFEKVANVLVTDEAGIPSPEGVAGPKLRADIDLADGFTFAWYPVIQTPACDPTTVTGIVKDFGVNPAGDPVAGATVSIPGYSPATTNAAGFFSIPGVVAGPNGPRCFTNPFSLRASAVIEIDGNTEQGSSEFVSGVPGGVTDVGCIALRGLGTVQGKLLKLVKTDPFTVVPLAGVEIRLLTFGEIETFTTTNEGGCYSFTDVPTGANYNVSVTDPAFDDEACPGTTTGNGVVATVGEVDVVNFRVVGSGKSKTTVTDDSGTPIPFTFVNMAAFSEDLGGGFSSPFRFDGGQTDDSGCVLFPNIPLGNYEVSTGFGGEFGPPPPGFGQGNTFIENRIDCDGQCNEDNLEIIPPDFDPCDLLDIAISPVDIDNTLPTLPTIAGLQFALTFLEEQAAASEDVEINITILFDTDNDDTTGITWFINGNDQIFGVDRLFECYREPFDTQGELNCSVISYENGFEFLESDFIGFEEDPADPRRLLLTLPTDAAAGEDLLETTNARVYIVVNCYPFRSEASGTDTWPDTVVPPPAPIDFLTPFNATDPQGDVFFDIFLD